MTKNDFFYLTRQKGQCFGNRKITNNSNYIIFYRDENNEVLMLGEVANKTAAINYIDNLVRHQRLTYTIEIRG